MDFFTNKRFSLWIIVLLIVINLFTLSIIWFNRAFKPGKMERRSPRQSEKPLELLQKELDLSNEQIERYDLLRQAHYQQTQNLVREIPRLKKEMMDEIFKNNPDTLKVWEYSKLIGEKQIEIERITFNHLLDLKELCGEEQIDKLHGLLNELFQKNQPPEGHHPGENPPHPLRREGERRSNHHPEERPPAVVH